MKGSLKDDKDYTTGEVGQGKGKVTEALPIYRSVATGTVRECLKTQSMVKSAFPGKTSSQEVKKKSGAQWIVKEAKPKPTFPLERAEFIGDSPQSVATRLYESLKKRSIQTDYAASRAFCRTMSFVSFSIDLYQGENGGTLVEVLRHSGCGFTFQKERRAILAAAKGGGSVPEEKKMVNLEIPAHLLKEFKAPTKDFLKQVLTKATDILQGEPDVQLFTLQNLVSMTTPKKAHESYVNHMPELIMDGSEMRDMIVAVVEVASTQNDEIFLQITNACLTIFSNSMGALVQSKELKALLDGEGKPFVDKIIPILVNIVKECRCPHNACVALRCLHLILESSDGARMGLKEGARKAVEDAQSYGKERHSNLEKQAELILRVM